MSLRPKASLHRSAGMERIWFWFRIICLAVLGVAIALYGMRLFEPSTDFVAAVYRDLHDPACAAYQQKSLSGRLDPPPSFSSPCWHLYSARSATTWDEVPFTWEAYRALHEQLWWQRFVYVLAAYAVYVAIIWVAGLVVRPVFRWLFRALT